MPDTASKSVLVTGGARRIGRHIALAFAHRGWNVAIHYRNSAAQAQSLADEIAATGRRAVLLHADLEDEQQARDLATRAIAAFGRLDCVVNNASLFEPDDAQRFSPALLERHMRANVTAPLLLAQALHAATPEGGQAVVVNLLDQKLYNLNPDYLSYTLSKAALHTATTTLAQALAPKLRVVGVAPGITMVSGDQTEEGFAKAHAMTPLGRSSTPEDVAAAVCFAAESPAITGTTLVVDGGQHLIPLQRDVMFVVK
ncbi:MAG TPA: SDR family oxidoreductase [Noviherbaspirillum sp.]|nr:SDR family oxidoreductase [Noviherbaspirillum sp.]